MPLAADDLDEIWYYIATEGSSIDVANRLIDSMTNRFFLLARHPHLGRERDADFGAGSRSFPIGEYVIVYSIDAGDVLILRVVHGRRDIETIFAI